VVQEFNQAISAAALILQPRWGWLIRQGAGWVHCHRIGPNPTGWNLRSLAGFDGARGRQICAPNAPAHRFAVGWLDLPKHPEGA